MKRISAIILASLIAVSSVISTSCSKKDSETAAIKNDPSGQNMYVYNVLDYGATGNRKDETAAIQKALDAAGKAGGGTVYIPTGIYLISKTLVKPANVSISGNNMWSTVFQWMGSNDGVIIDTSNQSLEGTHIEKLMFSVGNATKEVTCILGGSTKENNNSRMGQFRDLIFNHVAYGIRGNAEPDGYGISDSMFTNIFGSGGKYGLWLFGAGNTVIHPRFSTLDAAVVLDSLNDKSADGVQFIGGIFALNDIDVLIPNPDRIHPTGFLGTWFEDSQKGLLVIPTPDTKISNLSFRDCMLNSKSGMTPAFNAENALGTITVSSCTVYDNLRFVYPSDPNSRLTISDIQGYLTTQAPFTVDSTDKGIFTDSGNGNRTQFKIAHNLKNQPKTVRVTPATEDASGEYYVTSDEKNIIITFKEPPAKNAQNVKFYWKASC